MKIYEYENRVIVQYNDKSRINLSKKKYGVLFNQLLNQIKETNFKLGNPYIIEKDYVKVFTLHKNEVKEILLDYEDWFKLKEFTFICKSDGKYPMIFKEGKRRMVYRIIFNMDNDFNNKDVIDHINRNPFDNRKINLRLTTQSINNRNQGEISHHNNSTTGIKGIGICSRTGEYRVRGRYLNGKDYEFRFSNLQEAKEFNHKIRKENGYNI